MRGRRYAGYNHSVTPFLPSVAPSDASTARASVRGGPYTKTDPRNKRMRERGKEYAAKAGMQEMVFVTASSIYIYGRS